ncbi:MAG: ATP-binding cassette domain-containing protein, partial [Pseudorhodoplanes sp.]|nr:ATP-binding cassette domain-containing protein [Pseudorhodoplanes sp.]
MSVAERDGSQAAPAAGNILAVNNIEVVYDHVILVLKGVSLEVPAGGIVALLGANGAGKTTLANLIMGCGGYVPTAGEIRFQGQ